jgi:hypothetical protein
MDQLQMKAARRRHTASAAIVKSGKRSLLIFYFTSIALPLALL